MELKMIGAMKISYPKIIAHFFLTSAPTQS